MNHTTKQDKNIRNNIALSLIYVTKKLYLILYKTKDVNQTNTLHVGKLKLANYSSPI